MSTLSSMTTDELLQLADEHGIDVGDARTRGQLVDTITARRRDLVHDLADVPPPLDPDCLAGSHKACHGTAWDVEADDLVSCQCGRHEVLVTDVVESL